MVEAGLASTMTRCGLYATVDIRLKGIRAIAPQLKMPLSSALSQRRTRFALCFKTPTAILY